jgi:hypothetical protein
VELNPQPFPPSPGDLVGLNPQPLPPVPGEWVGLNPLAPYHFSTVFTTKVKWSHDDDGPTEDITFVYGALRVEYHKQDNDGIPDPWEQMGGSGGGVDIDCDGSPWYYFQHSDGGHHMRAEAGGTTVEATPCLWCPR